MFVRVNKYFCKTLFSRYIHNHSKSSIPTVVSLQYVRNLGYPSCLDCVHFVQSKYDNSPDLGKCLKFAKKELRSGEIKLESAFVMRISESDCGPYARYKQKIKDNYLKIVNRIQHLDIEK
jgi:hypothetical protein